MLNHDSRKKRLCYTDPWDWLNRPCAQCRIAARYVGTACQRSGSHSIIDSSVTVLYIALSQYYTLAQSSLDLQAALQTPLSW